MEGLWSVRVVMVLLRCLHDSASSALSKLMPLGVLTASFLLSTMLLYCMKYLSEWSLFAVIETEA
jgi:hypothetical protein